VGLLTDHQAQLSAFDDGEAASAWLLER